MQEDVNSRKGVERIIRYAFEHARKNGLKRVCMSDKSNAMTFAHDLWQRVFKEVRQEYADIESRHLISIPWRWRLCATRGSSTSS